MHPLLESAWAKLQRAAFHTDRINQAIDTFAKTQIQCVGAYLDRQTGEKIFRLDRPLQEPPAQIRPIIGDALFNYRCALDHLMQALVVQSKGTPTDRTQFPIFRNADGFNRSSQWQGVHPLIKTFIEFQQPYAGVYPHAGELLWQLHRLNIIDKHRHLHLVTGYYEGTFTPEGGISVKGWRQIQEFAPEALFQNVGIVNQGAILARIPRPYVNVNFVPSFEIMFGNTSEVASECRVRAVINSIGAAVHDIISTFEEFFFYFDDSRLGRLHSFSDAIRALKQELYTEKG